MTRSARANVEQVQKDIAGFDGNGKDKGQSLQRLTDEIADLRKSDPRHFQENLKKLSENDSLTKLGFPSGYQLVGMEGGKLAAVNNSEKGNGEIVRLDARTGKIEAPVDNKVSEQEMGKNGRKFKVNETGGAYYHVGDKGAENMWNIAKDYAMGKNNGQKPSNADILASVKELQDYNNIKNINKIHPGDTIKLPPGFNPKQWQGPEAPEKQPEAFKPTPVAAQETLEGAKKNNVIGTTQVEQPLSNEATLETLRKKATPGTDQAEMKKIADAAIVKGNTDMDNMTKAWNTLQNLTPEQQQMMKNYSLLDGKGKPDMTTSMFMSMMEDLKGMKDFTENPANKGFMDSVNYMQKNWGLKFRVGGMTHVDQAYVDRIIGDMKANAGMLAKANEQ